MEIKSSLFLLTFHQFGLIWVYNIHQLPTQNPPFPLTVCLISVVKNEECKQQPKSVHHNGCHDFNFDG